MPGWVQLKKRTDFKKVMKLPRFLVLHLGTRCRRLKKRNLDEVAYLITVESHKPDPDFTYLLQKVRQANKLWKKRSLKG